ncbi:hypothetical protein N7468_002382 [Penicillium chermesinum]|uniref:Uncharacterized protein n=1 Tax=Penicillium chermesinum TaxID=63820 RepID=A0A9W9PID2_9EURO|nr:uncharacterized protein N7468_002382 [Penicillium chermesinum]KAJ5247399.1 hypothetical protein N7468_002382 [Penicillium chermesinum]
MRRLKIVDPMGDSSYNHLNDADTEETPDGSRTDAPTILFAPMIKSLARLRINNSLTNWKKKSVSPLFKTFKGKNGQNKFKSVPAMVYPVNPSKRKSEAKASEKQDYPKTGWRSDTDSEEIEPP